MVKAEPDRARAADPECLCLRLRQAARVVSQIYDQHLAASGLTVSQYGLLGHLRAFDGSGIGSLAEKLIMDPTTLTRSLRPLERRGLLEVRSAPSDRRARSLHLTASGREALAAARPAWRAAQGHVAQALGSSDDTRLRAALDRLLERLNA